ncbi:VanZ family protein [Pedobacter sp. B4-66]|uniref:VanZ family protein n=1 Tax=Pedobacter sp. B4-66 TaxID=2817280 RepID=UPI001BDAB66A|nr:VanZ family protein [Pedobacter sp. B4-66]
MIKRIISGFILIAYCAFLVKIMIFKDVPLIRIGSLMVNFGGSQTGPPNLVPFRTILAYLLGEKGLMIGAINLIGNIILLLPVGLFFAMLYSNTTWKKMLIPAAAAGFAIEGMQVVLQVGIFDIDDVILNGLGVMVGYWGFTILEKRLRSMSSKNVKLTSGLSLAVVFLFVACVAAIYRKGQLPVSFEPGVRDVQSDQLGQRKGGIAEDKDPCGGTGGLGKIVHIGNHAITIEKSDGLKEVIKLLAQTKIRNSAGALSEEDLKIGNRATIVTFESDRDGNKIAAAVLVCGTQN